MLIIPYKVDVSTERRPISNYFIMLVTVAAFIFQVTSSGEQVKRFVLDGWSITELAGYMWLHTGYLHIIGNLVFLWVFGNAVCAKVGNFFYLLIYMGTGILAGIIHIIFDGRSAVGASGALYGIIGTYLVLYPFNSIKCLFIFIIYLRRFSIAGLWVILCWFILNVLGAITGYTAKAFFAHIGGFVIGVIWAIILLKLKLVIRDNIDDAIVKSLNI